MGEKIFPINLYDFILSCNIMVKLDNIVSFSYEVEFAGVTEYCEKTLCMQFTGSYMSSDEKSEISTK